VAGAVTTDASDLCSTTVPTGVDPMIGRVIDQRYVLTRRLGAGGMGVVYAARHEITGREVAIKVLHASAHQSDEIAVRFAREARTAAAIGHPNIVEILDAGTLPDRTPFLVMELLHGEALGHLLWREKRLTAERVADVVSQAALALAALHARGVVHRDVKTDNLFVENGGRVKLLDFGLAVFTDRAFVAKVTQDGVFNGTPQYMPPEVFDGGDPKPTWDVYALATVAFELLTGRLPFEDANPVVMLCSKRESVAPRLSDRADVRFPEALERVIRRGLERDPKRRYPTPVAFGDQLGRAVWGDDRASAGSGPLPSLPSRLRPSTGWLAPAALVVGACCGMLLGGATYATLGEETSEQAPGKTTVARTAARNRSAERPDAIDQLVPEAAVTVESPRPSRDRPHRSRRR
jgi:serine/threonine protein kinase